MDSTLIWRNLENELEMCEFPDEQDDVIVWGAGFMGQLETPLLKDLRVVAFCDTDKEKQTREILKLPCISPEQITSYSRPFILVSTIINYNEIKTQLISLEVKYCTLDAYVLHRYKKEFFQVYCSLDEISKNIFAQVLQYRLTGDIEHIFQICSDGQYFALPQFRFCSADEVFVDCGAFVGDVVEKFIENNSGYFKKIYAFEPNPAALEVMKRRICSVRNRWIFQNDKIVYEQIGVGKKCAEVSFGINTENASNCTVQVHSGNQKTIKIVSLDQYFTDCGEPKITFLKADIEGSEWDMLTGAQQMIRRCKPKLAISIYHNIFDFYRIPIFLKELVPEYRFSVRHHWLSVNETILYCYV